ncbi:IclR family transcriptional regulator [Mycobacterium sp. 21AC1]|uniref:IclR family transcriptional regulator n=1 Tax=[Mycobacterium] appelbergii TaxID=2939269 RepID=UPI0029393DC7|nr:IclR family transcriptional regulator [Mycobacterium sp. 21AC1]MDV3125928.1 IclR family transcriptional regulator [Mycobacterium sp. 21AC1]
MGAGHVLNTIDRTGKVLDLFTTERAEWGVTEIAAALRLPKSTTFDVVASLADIGLLQQTSDDRYRLGWRVLLISRRLLNATCFDAQTHRYVAELANQLAAVVTIGVWDGQGVVCIAHASVNRTEPILGDGTHISGTTSALGKLLMAQLPWHKVQERIDRYGLPILTQNSVSDIKVLRAQLVSARRNDFATEHGETLGGWSCIAVGIYQNERRMVAALSISMPTERMQYRFEEYIRIARRTSRAVLEQGVSSRVAPA